LKSWVSASGKLKVVVFEGSQRIGGRLLSARPPSFSAPTVCELGGMRYLSTQTLVRSLVENKLKLPTYEQVVYQDNNIAFLRDKQLRFAQANDPAALPYHLDLAEAQHIHGPPKNYPGDLMIWAAAKLLPDLPPHLQGDELKKYLREAKVDGTPLWQHGFWNLVEPAMSSEAYHLARSMVGFNCLGSNANAVDQISEYLDFSPDVTFHSFCKGYETLPWELQKRFQDEGGEVVKDAWLAGFDKTTLSDGSTGVELHFTADREPVKARAIILAMPRRSLELLRREGPVFDGKKAADVRDLLNSVRPIPLFKMFIAYKRPWWNASCVSQGRSLTDMPLRQLFYWPVDPLAKTPAKTGNALLMGYNDATSVDFWSGLSRRKKSSETPAHFRHVAAPAPVDLMFKRQGKQKTSASDKFGRRLLKNWKEHPVPEEMVNAMHRQIVKMHDIQNAPEPYDAAYMDWSVDPYGGGVHLWNPGYKSWDILHEMTEPVKDFPCYICGEAYSTNQTWVEGALQTAEIVLQNHLGLREPSWVTPNRAPKRVANGKSTKDR
jgi:monoamine oxidase